MSTEFISILWFMPIVFMLHDFEEIIFVRWWTEKDRHELGKRYPKLIKMYGNFSTASFALAVDEEFIIIILVTLTAVIFRWYYLWFGITAAFLFHLIIHVIQWLIYKKYIPCIVTSIPAVVYSAFAISFVYKNACFNMTALVIWCIISIILMIINLNLIHKLAQKLNYL